MDKEFLEAQLLEKEKISKFFENLWDKYVESNSIETFREWLRNDFLENLIGRVRDEKWD